MVTFAYVWWKKKHQKMGHRLLGLLISFLCALCPHGFSCILFIHYYKEYFSHIQVKWFRAVCIYWSVLPLCFLMGMSFQETWDTCDWHCILDCSSLSNSCALRSPGTKLLLGKLNSSCVSPKLRYKEQLNVKCWCFFCAGGLRCHQWSYLQNKKLLTGVSVSNSFC